MSFKNAKSHKKEGFTISQETHFLKDHSGRVKLTPAAF